MRFPRSPEVVLLDKEENTDCVVLGKEKERPMPILLPIQIPDSLCQLELRLEKKSLTARLVCAI